MGVRVLAVEGLIPCVPETLFDTGDIREIIKTRLLHSISKRKPFPLACYFLSHRWLFPCNVPQNADTPQSGSKSLFESLKMCPCFQCVYHSQLPSPNSTVGPEVWKHNKECNSSLQTTKSLQTCSSLLPSSPFHSSSLHSDPPLCQKQHWTEGRYPRSSPGSTANQWCDLRSVISGFWPHCPHQ